MTLKNTENIDPVLSEGTSLKATSPDNKPSKTEAFLWHLEIKQYLAEKPANPTLFVIFEGKPCPLSIQPDTGNIRFCTGDNNYCLIRLHREVVLTTGCAKVLLEYGQQKDVEKASSAILPDSEVRTYVREALSSSQNPDSILSDPKIKNWLADFKEIYQQENVKCGKVVNASEFWLLENLSKKADHLRKLLELLETRDFIVTKNNLKKTKIPHIVLYPDENSQVLLLLLEIAEITQCKKELQNFLKGKRTVAKTCG